MKTALRYFKYFILLPLLFIQFSCEKTSTNSTIYNGDVLGSWKLTALSGTYLYTVNLPDGNESGVTWASDTTFGIQATWDMADSIFTGAYAPFSEYGKQWLLPLVEGDTIPGVSQTTALNYAQLQGVGIGLIGVFEDAPSAGAYATYYFKGVYPSVSYQYSTCATGSATPTMTDQGIYKWDQTLTTGNFEIKRDPSIAGTQVLPPFNDGTLAFTDETLNTLNIKFLDKDSHSSLYEDIPGYVWDEGKHPNLTSQDPKVNSGGDRSYVAFAPALPIGPSPDGYGDMFYETSVGATSVGTGPAYVYNTALAAWGNYMTYNAWIFQIEMKRLGLSDTALVGHMLTTLGTDPTSTDQYFGMPYANLVSMGTDGETPTITDDSDHDLGTDQLLGGRMKYTIIHGDCAIPADVTIDFNATFERCTTDYCTGDSYHVDYE